MTDQERYDRFLEDLERLVGMDSGSDDLDGVARVAAFLAGRLEALGLETGISRQGEAGVPCLAAHTPCRSGRWDLLFLGHMDTVFPPGEAARRPFCVQGDRALGPGVNDMKGGLLMAVNVLEVLAEQGVLDDLAVRLAFNGDEETGSAHSRPWIEDAAALCDRVFVFEACRPGVKHVLSRKGSAQVTVVAHGRSCHSGTIPQTGVNAIVELAWQIGRINGLNRFESGVTAQCTMVRGGAGPSIVPDRAEAVVDLRYATMQEMEEALAFFEALPGETLLEGAAVDVAYGPRRPPMECTPESRELWRLLRDQCRGFGVEPETVFAGGCTDGNWTAAMGIPTVDGVGPVGGNSHRPDEYLDLTSVIPAMGMLVETCKRLARPLPD